MGTATSESHFPPAEDHGHELVDPAYYGTHGYPHEAWTALRRDEPVHWYERYAPLPFWAITRRREITEISRQPLRFINGPRTEIVSAADVPQIRSLITMDPPEHGRLRKVVGKRLTPRALSRLRNTVEAAVDQVLDAASTGGELAECDFVSSVASPYPITVVAWLLGVPGEDWRKTLRWINEVVGALDPEFRKGGESPEQTRGRAAQEMWEYLAVLLRKRRADPSDDLISFLAHAELDGRPIDDQTILEFAVLAMVAGNETTRNATSGGLLAFIEHPDQWERLRADPSLVASAVEEVLRWTSPVVHFTRTATEDSEVGGQKIRAGDTLALFYASANRDEEVFENPFSFQIDRHPNRHLAFGIGEHFCLGAHVARMELQVLFEHLARRLVHVEISGPVERLHSSTVGGLKRLPVRYALRGDT